MNYKTLRSDAFSVPFKKLTLFMHAACWSTPQPLHYKTLDVMDPSNKNRNKKKNRHNDLSNPSVQNDQLIHTDEEIETEPPLQSDVNESIGSKKRQHDDDDNQSDNEEDKTRRKKKKQQIISETGDKKGKKSIRQMKREKYAERQATAQATAKDQLKGQCLNYLSQWKHDKQNWKFMKIKQGWLYKNKFSTSLIPESSWPLLLEYFESTQGNIRKMLLEDASKIIKQMDEWTESQSELTKAVEEHIEDDEVPKNRKPDEIVYKRARDLIQCLDE